MSAELLDWLTDSRFIFLRSRDGTLTEDGAALRPVFGNGIRLAGKLESDSFAALPFKVQAKAREPKLLILTRANSRETAHPPHYLDGVKRFDTIHNPAAQLYPHG